MLVICDRKIGLNEVCAFSNISLSKKSEFIDKISKSRSVLQDIIENRKAPIYGVTTGFGDSGKNYLAPEDAELLQQNLYEFHGCGVGKHLSPRESYFVVLFRLISLSKGYSGVSMDLLEAMANLLNNSVYPAIPQDGSVGASGDLTPLSYVAAVLAGKREVYYDGELLDAEVIFKRLGIKAYAFRPKEALGIMNGTSAMSAVTFCALHDMITLLESFESFIGGFYELLYADITPLLDFVHSIKPHSGQVKSAKNILNKILDSNLTHDRAHRRKLFFEHQHLNIQDRYSIRCSPQILGVVWDTLRLVQEWLETEINSVNDNPLVCSDTDEIYTGCNFYGGYISQGADYLKVSVAQMADLLDKQFSVLVDGRFNSGLGDNLKLSDKNYHHGFKAMQITLSALSGSILLNSTPASIFSRTTESLNQDKVSMGMHAALTFRKSVEDFSMMLSIALLGLAQAIDIRGDENISSHIKDVYKKIRKVATPVVDDRRLEPEIMCIKEALINGEFI